MKAKHTAGPWIPQSNPDCIDIEGYKRIVAVVPGVDDESIDIARLIAAAPDLLAALENALYLADIYRKKEGDGLMVCAFQDIATRTRKAIAKATGA